MYRIKQTCQRKTDIFKAMIFHYFFIGLADILCMQSELIESFYLKLRYVFDEINKHSQSVIPSKPLLAIQFHIQSCQVDESLVEEAR